MEGLPLDHPELLIALAAGLFIGGISTALVFLRRQFRIDHQRMLLSQQNETLKSELSQRELELKKMKDERDHLLQREAELKARLEDQQRHNEEKLTELEQARNQLKMEFENLANKILAEKSRQFTELNKERLDELLQPVSHQLKEFRERIDEIHSTEQKQHGSLLQELRQLQDLNRRLNDEAHNLSRALRGDKKRQGTWGEIVLETVLERSGLRKGQEYDVQGSFRDADGNLLRPDVIVHLPEGKDIVIDSKVSLNAYQEYVAADDETEAEAALKRHLDAIRRHIDTLSSKNYEGLKGVNSLDFVLMFIPIEPAFSAAFQKDPDLFSKAYERHIIVVTPTTLLATLRTIENMWRFQRQQENVARIVERAEKLYRKLRGFLEDFEKIGRQLETTRRTYDDARNKLTDGKGNLIQRAEEFVSLGVKVKGPRIPKSLLDDARADEATSLEPETD